MTAASVARTLIALHIAGGTVALVSMWIPLFAKKGGRAHVRAGWVYVGGMSVICLSTWVLALERLWFEPAATHPQAIFLAFVALLAADNLWLGIRVLRRKSRADGSRHPLEIGPPLLLLSGAVALFAYGAALRVPLFLAFAPVGGLTAATQLRTWMRKPTEKMHWWFSHLGDMGGSCIATVTALLVVNAPRFHLPRTTLWVWFVPGLVGTALITWAIRRDRRRFSPRMGQKSARAPSLAA